MYAYFPLAEQHRIVAKVDSLMALCDALESRLKGRAGVQGRLAGAVVKQGGGMLEGKSLVSEIPKSDDIHHTPSDLF